MLDSNHAGDTASTHHHDKDNSKDNTGSHQHHHQPNSGRGGGRGRGRGRGGTGRGRGRTGNRNQHKTTTHNDNNETKNGASGAETHASEVPTKMDENKSISNAATTTTTDNEHNNNTHHNNNNNTNDPNEERHNHPEGGRGRGRGGRGRGRGRGGRGRGGRGRGRSHDHHHGNKHHEEDHHGDDDHHHHHEDENGLHEHNAAGEEASSGPNKDGQPSADDKPHQNGEQNNLLQDKNMDNGTFANANGSADSDKEAAAAAGQVDMKSPAVLSLPKPPQVGKGRSGGPVVLMRGSPANNNQANNGDNNDNAVLRDTGDDGAAATKSSSGKTANKNKEGKEKKKKPRNKPRKEKKKKKGADDEDEHGEHDNEEEADAAAKEGIPSKSATQVLEALPAQEVSITASTKVQVIKRNENSSGSLTKLENSTSAAASEGKSKKSKGKKNDSTKAARRFNTDVRNCVEQSDPDTMRALLRNKKHHKFALEAMVLETVMKAYLMAAMFDDALYCLRNCTLQGTLSTVQTERILQCLPQNLRNSSAFTAADMISSLCLATEFDTPTSRTYFLRIVRGISLEFLEEATSARDRICSAPCERLVRSGVCVVDARLKRGKKATELIVMPGEQLGVFVPDSMENRGIQAGDAVSILPYAGPYPMSAESLDRNMIEATVFNTNPMVIRLQDKTNAALHSMLTEPVEGNVYRIDKLANRMGFNRQLAAAVAVASPIDPDVVRDIKRPCPQLIQAITAMDESIDRAMKQTGGFQPGQLTSTAALCSEAIPWSFHDENENLTQDEIRQSSNLALEKYKALDGLNPSQRLAVEGATTNRLTLIQGPPGTGSA